MGAGPQRRDYIDGREIPFGAAFITHELELLHSPLDSELWRQEAHRYGINTLIFSLITDEVPFTLLKTDCDSKEWRPAYLDELSIVFVHNKPENEDLIRRFEVDCATAPLPRNPLPLTSTSFHPLLNASRMLFALGRNAEALSASDKAIAISRATHMRAGIVARFFTPCGTTTKRKRNGRVPLRSRRAR